jgi:hypothetical protein
MGGPARPLPTPGVGAPGMNLMGGVVPPPPAAPAVSASRQLKLV